MLPSSELKSTRKAPPTTLAIVVAMECKVVDVQAPEFIGMFAWYRLVRAWTAMRFDDHRGLVPSRMKLLALGLRGTLVRTKTSGANKKKQHLEVVVDRAAYLLHEDWLEVGWLLWQETPQSRDYFLGLPSPDLASMIPVEAKYADAVAMSHALFMSL